MHLLFWLSSATRGQPNNTPLLVVCKLSVNNLKRSDWGALSVPSGHGKRSEVISTDPTCGIACSSFWYPNSTPGQIVAICGFSLIPLQRIPAPQIVDSPPLAFDKGRCLPSALVINCCGYPNTNVRPTSLFIAKVADFPICAPLLAGSDPKSITSGCLPASMIAFAAA